MKMTASKYPSFNVIDEDPVSDLESEKFVALIKEILKGFRYSDREWIAEYERKFFMLMRKIGYGQASGVFGKRTKLRSKLDTLCMFESIGNYIINGSGQSAEIKKLIPRHLFCICPEHDAINITVKHFRTARLPTGPIWSPATDRFVFWNKQKLILAYSQHAIERMQERILIGDSPYRQVEELGYLFFVHLTYPACLGENHSPMIEFYMIFTKRDGELEYLNQVFEEQIDAKIYYDAFSLRFFYRVGYGPFVIDNGYAVVKSILFPGMKGTPEEKLILEKSMSSQERNNLTQAWKEGIFSDPKSQKQIALLEFLRNNGLQVIFNDEGLRARSKIHQ